MFLPKKLNKTRLRKQSKEILTFLLFVALATVAWFGHALSSVRNSVVPVRVEYVGIPEYMGLDAALPEQISMEVRDAGRRLGVYHRQPLTITIDLSGQIHGDKGEIRILQDNLRRSLGDLLQGTSKLQSVTPAEITGTYYRQHTKQVPLILDTDIQPARQYLITEEPYCSTTKVKIYGKRQQLDTIAKIYTSHIAIRELNDTLRKTVPLILPEGVRCNTQEVELIAVAEQFTEKVLILPIQPQHVPEGTHLHIFPNNGQVTLRVAVSHFSEVGEGDVSLYCNYPTKQAESLSVDIRYSNPHILGAKVNPASVEFIIEK